MSTYDHIASNKMTRRSSIALQRRAGLFYRIASRIPARPKIPETPTAECARAALGVVLGEVVEELVLLPPPEVEDGLPPLVLEDEPELGDGAAAEDDNV